MKRNWKPRWKFGWIGKMSQHPKRLERRVELGIGDGKESFQAKRKSDISDRVSIGGRKAWFRRVGLESLPGVHFDFSPVDLDLERPQSNDGNICEGSAILVCRLSVKSPEEIERRERRRKEKGRERGNANPILRSDQKQDQG